MTSPLALTPYPTPAVGRGEKGQRTKDKGPRTNDITPCPHPLPHTGGRERGERTNDKGQRTKDKGQITNDK
ncbi:hypothetical protein [[Phormidium] sp. ETS-05]|uniref:hypothetical protein n=1 Tax=[Phormidium] sp. ETS-05 TaxID=222819 RepID=UPI0018EF0D30|nr:hypothetical protein [[Phormidium] sp. ETS-05]